MQKKIFVIIAALFISFCCFAAPAQEPGHEYVPGEIIITFEQGISEGRAYEIAGALGLEIKEKQERLNVYRCLLPSGSNAAAYTEGFKSKKVRGIKYVELNFLMNLDYVPMAFPDDPFYSAPAPYNMWHINKMQVDMAWNVPAGSMNTWSLGTTSTVIAIIDTGVNINHEDLVSKVVAGRNFSGVGTVTDTTDNYFHGTKVASAAGAAVNNAKGICGVAALPKIMPVKIGDTDGITSYACMQGIMWAADNGADVINMSVGAYDESAFITNACAYAVSKGCVLMAASGNDNTSAAHYPAASAGVIAVGASSNADNKSGYSNYAGYLAFVAPGDFISTAKSSDNTGYGVTSGTSISTPMAAGMAAVLLSNGVPWYEAVSRMARSCDKAGTYPYAVVAGKTLGTWNQYMGYGRLNFLNAMKTLVPPQNLYVAGSIGSVDLAWEEAPVFLSPPMSYNVYRSTSPAGPFTKVNDTPVTSLSFSDYGVDNGTIYYYYVTAIDYYGFETKPGDVITAIAGGVTMTRTYTRTYTASPTFTRTPDFTPSRSDTPTATDTPTVTETVTGTPGTASITLTDTIFMTETITQTLTFTLTATATPTATRVFLPGGGCCRLDPDFNGSGIALIDLGLGDPPSSYSLHMTVDDSGRAVMAGSRQTADGSTEAFLSRLTSGGILDTTFNSTGYFYYGEPSQVCNMSGAAVDSSNRIVASGFAGGRATIWRFLDDGTPDVSLNGTGMVKSPSLYNGDIAFCLSVENSGIITVSGFVFPPPYYSPRFAVWRFNDDGSPDTSFNPAGSLVGGDDPEFGVHPAVLCFYHVIDASGKILLCGVDQCDTGVYIFICRINPDGTYDASFGGNGIITFAVPGVDTSEVRGMIIDSSGKVVLAGMVSIGSVYNPVILRFLSDGSLDTSFNSTGYNLYGTHPGYTYSVVQDGEGEYITAGGITDGLGRNNAAVIKYRNDGALDTDFSDNGLFAFIGSAGGPTDGVTDVKIDFDSRIILSGSAEGPDLSEYTAAWRLIDECGKNYTPTRTTTPGLGLFYTVTQTLTATCTRTLTLTKTITPPPTMTHTVSPTPQGTFTGTPTFTPTLAITDSLTFTATATPTVTMSQSATLTPADTPTISATPSITITQFVTATYTQTATLTPTATPAEGAAPAITDPFFSPNPHMRGEDTVVSFTLEQSATDIKTLIYTAGFRLVRQIPLSSSLRPGSHAITIQGGEFDAFGSGTYFCVITGTSRDGVAVRSKPFVFLVIKIRH